MITKTNSLAEKIEELLRLADLVLRFLEAKRNDQASEYLEAFIRELNDFLRGLPIAVRMKFSEYVEHLEEEETMVSFSQTAQAWPEIADHFDFGIIPALQAFRLAVETGDISG